MSQAHPRILSIGVALPDTGIDQARAAEIAATLSGAGERDARALHALHRRSGVNRRGAVVVDGRGEPWFYGAPPGAHADETSPSTARRLALFETHALPLAERAAREALGRAPTDPADVTHLITVSCTGFAAPGIDHALIANLPLSPSVARTNIGFMGCHAAINGLRVAESIARADPDARVLLCCVELCSIHFQYDPRREGQAVANTLFADGAAATVITSDANAQARSAARSPSLRATASRIFPGSADAMSWRIGDRGFEMSLSSRVPDLLRDHAPRWIDGFLARHGLARADVRGWAIHPGGPRVVATLREALGLHPEHCAHSTGVLADHGNMSSPTVLFILERLRALDVPRPWLALAFGPGLAGEAALLT